ncbi:hypothetical protein D9M73_238710 [compost metagenome]
MINQDAAQARAAHDTEFGARIGTQLFNLYLDAVLVENLTRLACGQCIAVFILQCEVAIFPGG